MIVDYFTVAMAAIVLMLAFVVVRMAVAKSGVHRETRNMTDDNA